MQAWKIGIDDALARIPGAPERGYAEVMRRASMHAGLYAPRGIDDQTPHDQDEIYIVWRGSGTFLRGTERVAFAPGDLLFVPAGMVHRFEEFTDDLALWVVFWGPPGGEIPQPG